MKTRAVIIISLLISAGAAFADRIIVDNVSSSPHVFTTTGTWTSFNNVSGYYGYNFLLASGPSTAAARWRPSVVTAGVYKIYMKWTAYSSRADRVPIEINYDGGTKTEFTQRMNQKINGGVWVYLGSYFLRSGTGNSVRITAGDDGLACADAVLFELSYATTTSPTDPALTTARAEYDDYKITRADAAPTTVYYNGGGSSSALSIDQTATNSVWVSIGTYYLTSGTGNSVKMSAADTGEVIADAVKFELASNPNVSVIVDNDTSGYTKSGSWPKAVTPAGYYGTNYEYNVGNDAGDVVRWRPTIGTAGNYNVYMRWPSDTDLRDRPEEVQIVRTDAGAATGHAFELRVGGQPFEVKGSCGTEAVEEIAAIGGNSVRAYSTDVLTPDFMRRCSDANIKVLVGLWMAQGKGVTSNFYNDAASVSNQFEEIKTMIDTYKNYESVLAWGVGNEIDPTTVSNPENLYKAVDQIARYIKDNDHYHPSMTCHAGADQTKIDRVRKWAPNIDIVAANSYYPFTVNVTSNLLAAGWNGPSLIVEYFLRQPFTTTDQTSWGAILEKDSWNKYVELATYYANDILPQLGARVLGGFVFKGSQGGFRVTHTWYPILDENLKPTPSYDAIRLCWDGVEDPDIIAPKVTSLKISGKYASESLIVTNNTGTLTVTSTIAAPSGSTVEYLAEIRTNCDTSVDWSPPVLDVTITEDSETPGKFYILNTGLPNGDYRLFYYVRRTDGAASGDYVSVGTANFPFRKNY